MLLDGDLTIRTREGDFRLAPGELLVVPAGTEHCPVARGVASVLLLEPNTTLNTGDAPESDLTVRDLDWI